MTRYIAVATDYNVLNLVALAAVAREGDEVMVLADPRMRQRGGVTRFEERLAARGLVARVHDLRAWTLAPMEATAAAAVGDWGSGEPKEIQFLAIGGRKHDALILWELLRRATAERQITLGTISVDRRPLAIRRSSLSQSGHLHYRGVPLSSLSQQRRVTLDEVLALNGYTRTTGTYVGPDGPLPSVTRPTSGQVFELAVLGLVHRFLSAETGPFLNELWWNVEVLTPSGRAKATEFDVLLLACDGSVVHFECKTDRAAGMQHKAFQMRRIFTPESRFVICHAVHGGMSADDMHTLRDDLRAQYENVGDFELVLFNQRRRPQAPLSAEIPAPAIAIRRILEAAWAAAQ